MSDLETKIGQMLMVGLEGEALSREEQAAIDKYGFGGFILFDRNCREPAQVARLCRSLWDASTAERPLIAIDHEGGRIHRLPGPFTHFPAAQIISRTSNPELAYAAARATATELALVGINVNFAPVLDVNSNPMNPVIGERSFGASPEEVIRFAERWIAGSRDGGTIPCAKHFPGHGDTDKDSHLDLPTVDKPLAELRRIELEPFIHACSHGVESLMTAHVLFRALDPKWPATLSRAIIGGVLREDLAYQGVVFSDDLEMKAISDNYGPEESAQLAVRAGVDMLLYCREFYGAIHAVESLCAGAQRDPALRRRVEESHRRVTRLKRCHLKGFTGAPEGAVEKRLLEFNHQRLVERIHGSR